ncbi:MAG: SAM-dependent chlorinase/fluorinase, partial [Cyanobacteria bacterium Co-bin8]|nr:SAM-dependent chlorinase/fluorinase [Cyanobacteria bacterium Co-bin8]
MAPAPLITLLTDFGTQDAYVGILKGVIAEICPEARVIDLTHEIAPQDLLAARFNLLNA